LFADLDDIALPAPEARDVNAPSIHAHMAMADELAGRKRCRNKRGSINDSIETPLKKSDEVFGRIAPEPRGLRIDEPELALGDVRVIALQLLLCLQLRSEVRGLSPAALAMLARSIFALVERAFRTAPEIFPEAAINFMFGADALCHVCAPKKRDGGAGPPPAGYPADRRLEAVTGMQKGG